MHKASPMQFTHRFNNGPEDMDYEQEVLLCVLPDFAGGECGEDLLQIPRIVMHHHNAILLIIPHFFPK